MPRKGHVAKRDVLPDPIYNSKLVSRLINNIMQDGKKVLHKQFYITHLISSLRKQVVNQWKYSKKQSKTSCLY